MKNQVDSKKSVVINFKKTRSLLIKLIEMTENDEYCIDIMQQNLAAIGLLKSAHQKLMEQHLNHCVYGALASKQNTKKQSMIKEIVEVTKLFGR